LAIQEEPRDRKTAARYWKGAQLLAREKTGIDDLQARVKQARLMLQTGGEDGSRSERHVATLTMRGHGRTYRNGSSAIC